MRFVDTNILLYAVSALSEDTHKRRRAVALLNSNDLALSVQVLQEFYHQSTRASRREAITSEHALQFIETLRRFPIQAVTLDVFHAGITISRRFGISYWDGAILAAARALGCEAVYSEDLSADQDYAGLRVINPFREESKTR